MFDSADLLTVGEFIDDPAIGKPDRALGACGQFVVVRDHQDGLAGMRQVLKEMKDHLCGFRIEVAGRLVRGEQDRIVRQGTGNGHTLLLPAGEGIGQTVCQVCHADQLEQVHGVLGTLGWWISSAVIHGKQDILDGSQGGQELEELEDHTHRAAAPDRDLLFVERMDREHRSTMTSPEVGRSMPVMTLISVDLPLPDLPMMETKAPDSTCRSMPLSAVNVPALPR